MLGCHDDSLLAPEGRNIGTCPSGTVAPRGGGSHIVSPIPQYPSQNFAHNSLNSAEVQITEKLTNDITCIRVSELYVLGIDFKNIMRYFGTVRGIFGGMEK